MTHSENPSNKSFDLNMATKPMLLGGIVGLAVAIFFIVSTQHPHVEWGKFWIVRPLIVLTFAGATAGLFYHIMGMFRNKGTFKTILINTLCFIVLIIGLWMGIVLGFHGTLWN